MMKTKVCPGCLRELPLTNEYYNKKSRNPIGFQSRCKQCQSIANKKLNDKKKMIPVEKIKSKGITKTFIEGKNYQIDIPLNSKSVRVFLGQVVQVTSKFVTFRHLKYGFCESFLRWDLENYKTKELV